MSKDFDPELETELTNLVQKIVQGYAPQRVILFGSRACGTAQPNSDIDLCIIKDGVEQESNRSYRLRRLLRGANYPLDLLVYSSGEVAARLQDEDPFIKDITQNGKILYQSA